MKPLITALVTALAVGVLAAPAEARETSWGCPSCRHAGTIGR